MTETLFNVFEEMLSEQGYIGREDKIVDASFVEAPRQRNSREENKKIKEGEIPDEWKDNPHKLSQKDVDARWTKKNDENFYGYKNHIKVDKKSKLIESYHVSSASEHDSQALEKLLIKDEQKDAGQSFYADSAYTGPDQEKVITGAKMKNCYPQHWHCKGNNGNWSNESYLQYVQVHSA